MNTITRKGAVESGNLRELAHRPGEHRAATSPTGTPVPAPRDRIRARAYEVFRDRVSAGRPGDANSDWLKAERELNGGTPQPPESPSLELKSRVRGERLLASGK